DIMNTNITTRPSVLLLLLLSAGMLLSSCSKTDITDTSGEEETEGSGNTSTSLTIEDVATISSAKEGNTDSAYDADDLIANSSFTSQVLIAFDGTSATITNPLSASGVSVTISSGDVTVTSAAKNVAYVISGTTSSGSVKIYSDNKFKLTLNGATITNNDGPAINIQSKKRVFIEVADNTTNTLTDGSAYA